jgi:hypothetical protein
LSVAEVERRIYFYGVQMRDGEWRRADVLRALDGLSGDDRLLPLGDDSFAWAKVDRIPRGRESGRLRLFRIRRSNLPGVEDRGTVTDLQLSDTAGLAEPSHVVLGGDGLIAAEFNFSAPRMSVFERLLREKLELDVRIGTYLQGDIVEQLDRLDYINLFELSVVPTPALEAELRDAGRFGDAVASLSQGRGGRRVALRLSGERGSSTWTDDVRGFVKRLLQMGADEHAAKVLRVQGLDPVTGEIEVVDLLKQKLVRRVDIEKSAARSKALNTSSAYEHIEEAVREVRESDLPTAAVVH